MKYEIFDIAQILHDYLEILHVCEIKCKTILTNYYNLSSNMTYDANVVTSNDDHYNPSINKFSSKKTFFFFQTDND
jgi:hypothetical protein